MVPFIHHDGISINFELRGDPEAVPLVLMHWFMGSKETFHDVGYVRLLAPKFRLILPDHRGYGQSSKPHEPSAYHPKEHVKDIVAILDHLEIDRAHFLGYSMGGRIGFALAAYTPQRVRSLTIGGMHPFKDIPTDLEQRKQLLKQGMEAVLDAYGIHMWSVRQKMLENDPQALLADTIQTQEWPGFGEQLKECKLPILLYVGSEDPFYNGAREAAELLPNVTFVGFPGEDHRSAFVKRTLLVPHLARFLGVSFD